MYKSMMGWMCVWVGVHVCDGVDVLVGRCACL